MNHKKTIDTVDYSNQYLRRHARQICPEWYDANDVARRVGSIIAQAVWFSCHGRGIGGGPIESLNWAMDIGREDHYIAPAPTLIG